MNRTDELLLAASQLVTVFHWHQLALHVWKLNPGAWSQRYMHAPCTHRVWERLTGHSGLVPRGLLERTPRTGHYRLTVAGARYAGRVKQQGERVPG